MAKCLTSNEGGENVTFDVRLESWFEFLKLLAKLWGLPKMLLNCHGKGKFFLKYILRK